MYAKLSRRPPSAFAARADLALFSVNTAMLVLHMLAGLTTMGLPPQPCGAPGKPSNASCPGASFCNPTNPQPNALSRCGTDERSAWQNCGAAPCATDKDCRPFGPNATCYDDVNCGAGTCDPLRQLEEQCNWFWPCDVGMACMCIDCAPVGPPPPSQCCKIGTMVGAQICRGVSNARG